ncbi:MAG: type VI secretion system ATPase TssH [Bacteroidetes bacterium]|nr:type VI secretion system ATPase TssH [Bacteroidota bacterium]
MEVNLKTLTDKLNPVCRRALETAAHLCVAQTHFNIEIEHFLIKLLEVPDSDLSRLLRHYDLRAESLMRDMTRAMERFKRGNSRAPYFSPHIQELLTDGWTVSSLLLGETAIRSGALFLAIYENESIRSAMAESSPTILRITREQLRRDLADIIRGSGEDAYRNVSPSGGSTAAAANADPNVPAPPAGTQALDLYTEDLTAKARAGKIDPILGRDYEIRQIIDILTRRRQNNPILTGEAGVGKTAVVEGFAQRLVAGDVPPSLQNVVLRTLDLGLLQAGAGVKGEFENRLKSVINEVKSSPTPIILFIDEAHTLIGAGGQAGQGDAANLLKPALARGELRTVAATTWSEYKKYFEKDPALTRRFQPIVVEEPSVKNAIYMLRGQVDTLEKHHGVRILDEAVREAVKLSDRYITGRQLPDKAISVLDTACARVGIKQNDTPVPIENIARRMQQIDIEIPILQRESLAGADHFAEIAELQAERERIVAEKAGLGIRWRKELALVGEYRDVQKTLEEITGISAAAGEKPETPPDISEYNGRLESIRNELSQIQGDEPMVPLRVDTQTVASIIGDWTGIPIGKMVADEIQTMLHLSEKMRERVVGQDHALDIIAKRIQTSKAELTDPDKPIGVFLLAGTSGVGKTETAITLAEILYGGERNLISINMSEYQEAHTVSSLKGSPPGYVGYGQGGVLTEAVRRNPYSVVLLDEVEKAHPDVMELFYQVFDKGVMEDGEGVQINFRNTVILLTTNVGTDTIFNACALPQMPDVETLVEYLRPELMHVFKPALVGRMTIVPYYPLDDEIMKDIVRLKIRKIQRRFAENHRAELTYDDAIVSAIVQRCTAADTGARAADNILSNNVLPTLSMLILERMAAEKSFERAHISLNEDGNFLYGFDDEIETMKSLAQSEAKDGLPDDNIVAG